MDVLNKHSRTAQPVPPLLSQTKVEIERSHLLQTLDSFDSNV